jgi:predicted kinase
MIVGAAAAEPDRFAERVVEERGAVFSLARIRRLLAGKVGDDEIETKSRDLLNSAVQKRLQAGQTVVVAIEGFDPAERVRYVRFAHGQRRPVHLILLEAARDQVQDEERPGLDELRRSLDAGELGSEGFATVLRLGGSALSELKRVVFQTPPRND